MRAPTYLGPVHTDALLAGLLLLTQEVAVLQHRVAVLEAERAGEPAPEPGAAGAELTVRLTTELADRAAQVTR